MACTPDCARPTPFQAHCSVCHRTFGGITGFDAHRHRGACLDPATLGYVLKGAIWRRPFDQEGLNRRIGNTTEPR